MRPMGKKCKLKMLQKSPPIENRELATTLPAVVTGTLPVTQPQRPMPGGWLLPTHEMSPRATSYLGILLLEGTGEPEDSTNVCAESAGQRPKPVSLDLPGPRRVTGKTNKTTMTVLFWLDWFTAGPLN